jgi:hypothetical protein
MISSTRTLFQLAINHLINDYRRFQLVDFTFVHQLLGHNTRHEAEQLSLLKASMTFDAMALASCGSACQ